MKHIIMNSINSKSAEIDRVKVLIYLCFNFVSVRKPRHAKTVDDQVRMLTFDIFSTVYRSVEFAKRYLLEGGFVLNLKYPDHKWKFINGGESKN